MNNNLKLPEGNKFVQKMMNGWFGGWAGYLEYQRSKKIADAMAENEANKVKMAGKIEEKVILEKMSIIEGLESSDRFIEYENLYNVLTKAVPKIDIGSDGKIDDDKMKRLKDISKEFSSDEMQELISNIIAGEYNKPGSYGINTISVIKNLSKDDIKIFRRFGSIIIDGELILKDMFVLNSTNFKLLRKEKIYYEDYLYLIELGLITGNNSAQKMEKNDYNLKIGNEPISLDLEKEIILHNIILTRAGIELFQLVKPLNNKEAFKICKNELIKIGFKEKVNT